MIEKSYLQVWPQMAENHSGQVPKDNWRTALRMLSNPIADILKHTITDPGSPPPALSEGSEIEN